MIRVLDEKKCGEEDDRGRRRDQEGHRQQDRHPVDRAEPRHGADEQPQRDPDNDQQDVDRL